MHNYHLQYWGEVCNDDLINKELGFAKRDFFFKSAQDRSDFKKLLASVANKHHVIIVFRENEGDDVHKRTIAKMNMVMPNGDIYPFEHDFGYCYEPELVEYIFTEGNYSCDCNRSIFLQDQYPEIEELDCGDTIKLANFEVIMVDDEMGGE